MEREYQAKRAAISEQIPFGEIDWDNASFVRKHDHIEVYVKSAFMFSADTMAEARKETDP